MGKTAAILYKRDAYDTSGQRLVGRQAAGEGFLKGLVQHGTSEFLYCYASTTEEFDEFCQLIQPWVNQDHPRAVEWISTSTPEKIAIAGTLYRADPVITPLVWQRRFGDQRAYSVCGVTHTISTKGPMEVMCEMLIAPVQPWDALICTSKAVKTGLENVLGNWAEYLAQRFGSRTKIPINLPIIPLGVDCDAFDHADQKMETRDRLRQELGIAADDLVILYVGRLNFYAKAHPVPMYMAIEAAAQATGLVKQDGRSPLHFILAGWFESQEDEERFQTAANLLCPSVNLIFLDGRKPEIRSDIWSVGDIFISLADNTQETFGLTPIEAMSSGLPVIVSDWNGYQESVRDGVDGFKIPTIIPDPGACVDLAESYWADRINYITYSAFTAMVTSVDIPACTRALAILLTNPELRQKMGENGRQRARAVYDWQVVITTYEQLWQELAEIRATAPLSVPLDAGRPPIPFCDDPFRMFTHYSHQVLHQQIMLKTGQMSTAQALDTLGQVWLVRFGGISRTPIATLNEILVAINQAGGLSVETICNHYANHPQERDNLIRSLVYLLKFNILEIANN